MKTRLERFEKKWKIVAIYESGVEALLCLPATGRVLHSSVRLAGTGGYDPDLENEPLPRGVRADIHNGERVFVFSP